MTALDVCWKRWSRMGSGDQQLQQKRAGGIQGQRGRAPASDGGSTQKPKWEANTYNNVDMLTKTVDPMGIPFQLPSLLRRSHHNHDQLGRAGWLDAHHRHLCGQRRQLQNGDAGQPGVKKSYGITPAIHIRWYSCTRTAKNDTRNPRHAGGIRRR